MVSSRAPVAGLLFLEVSDGLEYLPAGDLSGQPAIFVEDRSTTVLVVQHGTGHLNDVVVKAIDLDVHRHDVLNQGSPGIDTIVDARYHGA